MRTVTAAVVMLAAAFAVAGCGRPTEPADPDAYKDLPVREFTLKDLSGNTLALNNVLKTKVILLDFSATWCPPCSQAVPVLKAAFEAHRDKLALIAIYSQEPQDTVEAYVKDHGITYPVLTDASGNVAQRYDVRAIPTFFVIDLEGVIRYMGHDPEEATAKAAALIGG